MESGSSKTLHSTMSLLNLKLTLLFLPVSTDFTFHNVSIKSNRLRFWSSDRWSFTFHNVSIKSILSRLRWILRPSFTFHNVSIKSSLPRRHFSALLTFTFHNVSIKSDPLQLILRSDLPLHSTMSLLNPTPSGTVLATLYNFTFHNVSIKSVIRDSTRV